MSLLKSHRTHGGELRVYTHASTQTQTPMTFSVFLPPSFDAAAAGSVPLVLFLSGLTCTWENFSTKAGAYAAAAAHGLAVVAPDTSPRGAGVRSGEPGDWSLGLGASFYVDATTPGWQQHYQMESYLTQELPAVLAALLPALAPQRASIMGHSMGGLGALSLALRAPARYRAVSAFAPIACPSAAPWGRKAYAALLGEDKAAWRAWDPTALVAARGGGGGGSAAPPPIWIEQGGADEWLDKELLPHRFTEAAAAAGVPVSYTLREGYDHSYYLVSSFIADHIARHAALLRA